MSTEKRGSRRGGWVVAALVAAGLAAAGCGAATQASVGSAPAEGPAKVEAVAGKDVKRVTLTELAAKRVGVETVPIAAAPGGTMVPYAAVVYTPDGGTWVFVETATRSYQRERVVIANIGGEQGSEAFLSQSPAVGTTVVKTGVMELYGAELGVGK